MLVVVSLLMMTTMLAGAHAELESSEPAEGATVPPPERVTTTFSQEVAQEGSTLIVRGPDGEQVDAGDGGLDLDNLDRNVLAVSLPPDIPDGEYTVEWTTVSVEDDDTVSGSFTFTVDANAQPPAPAPDTNGTETADDAGEGTPAVVAPTGTLEPVGDVADDNDDGGIGRGTLIVGGVAIAVALAVVASIGRRRWWR
jgi:methionine-rich copper-binding protein CopC